jgi:hypothetical protein
MSKGRIHRRCAHRESVPRGRESGAIVSGHVRPSSCRHPSMSERSRVLQTPRVAAECEHWVVLCRWSNDHGACAQPGGPPIDGSASATPPVLSLDRRPSEPVDELKRLAMRVNSVESRLAYLLAFAFLLDMPQPIVDFDGESLFRVSCGLKSAASATDWVDTAKLARRLVRPCSSCVIRTAPR